MSQSRQLVLVGCAGAAASLAVYLIWRERTARKVAHKARWREILQLPPPRVVLIDFESWEVAPSHVTDLVRRLLGDRTRPPIGRLYVRVRDAPLGSSARPLGYFEQGFARMYAAASLAHSGLDVRVQLPSFAGASSISQEFTGVAGGPEIGSFFGPEDELRKINAARKKLSLGSLRPEPLGAGPVLVESSVPFEGLGGAGSAAAHCFQNACVGGTWDHLHNAHK